MLAGEPPRSCRSRSSLSVPPVLGHAGLASLDVAAAATVLLALYALQRWLDHVAAWRAAALFGLASGLAVVTKFSAVPFVGLALLALGATHFLARQAARAATPEARAARPHATRAGLALAALAGLVPVFLAYGTARRRHGPGRASASTGRCHICCSSQGCDHALGVLARAPARCRASSRTCSTGSWP